MLEPDDIYSAVWTQDDARDPIEDVALVWWAMAALMIEALQAKKSSAPYESVVVEPLPSGFKLNVPSRSACVLFSKNVGDHAGEISMMPQPSAKSLLQLEGLTPWKPRDVITLSQTQNLPVPDVLRSEARRRIVAALRVIKMAPKHELS